MLHELGYTLELGLADAPTADGASVFHGTRAIDWPQSNMRYTQTQTPIRLIHGGGSAAVTTTVTGRRLRECVSAVLAHVQMDDVHVVRIECRGAHPVVDGPFEVDSALLVKAQQRAGALDAYSHYDVSATGSNGTKAWNVRLEMVGVWRADEAAPAFDEEHLGCFALAIGEDDAAPVRPRGRPQCRLQTRVPAVHPGHGHHADRRWG